MKYQEPDHRKLKTKYRTKANKPYRTKLKRKNAAARVVNPAMRLAMEAAMEVHNDKAD